MAARDRARLLAESAEYLVYMGERFVREAREKAQERSVSTLSRELLETIAAKVA